MPRALPVTLAPRQGESIESWLEHLAAANGLDPARLLALIGTGPRATRYLTLLPSPETITRLAALARVDEDAIRWASLASFDGTALNLAGLDHEDRHSYRTVAARGWAAAHGTQICPACLGSGGVWKSAWRLMVLTACTHHEVVLVATCPGCRRPFRDQRHSYLRRVGANTVCGNPLGAGPIRQCQQLLTEIATAASTPETLATQARVQRALKGDMVTVLGEPTTAKMYLGDLRYLTTLLLHLATQPGADALANWAPQLRMVAQARTGARGPRWGIRPPDDPTLRGHALSVADQILDSLDLDAAAQALLRWIELTPATTEGPLGWLADRTVMTATLTRLVTAARAPHRRLSHHLDTCTRRAMSIDTPAVPQVIPADLFTAHLTGASTSRGVTVRRFASLCLTRTHPDITSWAAAALALDMPAAVGVSTARSCSATMTIDHQQWTRRLEKVWADLPAGADHRVNYRALEDKVRHRAGLHRWFDDWVRRYRPATRPESRGHALTWQWVHVAHGHLDLAPVASDPRPARKRRHEYRHFESSLSDLQQRELAYALHFRP